MNTEQLWLNGNCIWIIFLGSQWHDLLTSSHGKPQKVEETVHSEGCLVIWDNGVHKTRTWKLVEKVQVDPEESWHFYDWMGLLIKEGQEGDIQGRPQDRRAEIGSAQQYPMSMWNHKEAWMLSWNLQLSLCQTSKGLSINLLHFCTHNILLPISGCGFVLLLLLHSWQSIRWRRGNATLTDCTTLCLMRTTGFIFWKYAHVSSLHKQTKGDAMLSIARIGHFKTSY